MLKAITSTAWLFISKKESSGESRASAAVGLKQGESRWSRPDRELWPGVSIRLLLTFSWDRGTAGCSLFSEVCLNRPRRLFYLPLVPEQSGRSTFPLDLLSSPCLILPQGSSYKQKASCESVLAKPRSAGEIRSGTLSPLHSMVSWS